MNQGKGYHAHAIIIPQQQLRQQAEKLRQSGINR